VRRILALVAPVLALAVLPATVASAGAGPHPATAGGGLVWRSCDQSFRCATLSVPIIYGQRSSGTVALAVIELASTSAHPLGDIVFNPGGPGASGVQFLEQTRAAFPASLRASFNLVSFDPRGIGESGPLGCGSLTGLLTFAEENPAPSTPAAVSAVVAGTKTFVAACLANSPKTLLDHVGTVDTVQDLDRLRAALGDPKLTYVGFSYGTYLGERYAQKYPTHVRAMVLDGAIDPALGAVVSAKEQADGFEQNLRGFFRWCASTESCSGTLPTNPAQAYEELFRRLEAGAVVPSDAGPGDAGLPPLNFAIGEVGVIATLYAPSTWPTLGEALAAALEGDGSVFSKLALDYEGLTTTRVVSNILAANVAINCEDSGALGSLAEYESLARQLAPSAPDFGASEAWGSLTCKYWPVPPSEQPGPITAKGAPPIVVVGGTEDPATPYSWAQGIAHELAHGVLLTRTGFGHTSYFFSSCVRTAIDRYLISLETPAAGTVCPSD